MARIQLRDTTIYIEDGLSGTCAVDLPPSAFASAPVVETVKGVVSTTDEVQTLPVYANDPSGGTFTISFDVNGGETFTTGVIAFGDSAATIEGIIDTAATGVVTAWTNGDITVSGGDLTTAALVLTFDGTSVDQFDHALCTVDGDLLTGVVVTGSTTLWIDTNVFNSDVTTLLPVGARFTIAGEAGTPQPIHTVTARNAQVTNVTDSITFTPALAAGVADDAVITVTAQRLTIKIGEGDLSWTEAREFIYDLDRDLLDTVREGQEQPVEIELAFIFDFVTTESGQAITPVDALKRIGEAAEWVNSSSDPCEPYAVDIYVVHCVPCGTEEDQDFRFNDFRYESLDYSIQDASISVSGRCNISSVTTTRSDIDQC